MEAKKDNSFSKEIKEMKEANLAWGSFLFRTHPKIRKFLFGIKNHLSIFDLKKTKEMLDKALDFLKNASKENKTILFVGLNIPSKKPVKETAKKLGYPWIVERWTGGFLTNFSEIKKRIERLKELEEMKEKGEMEKYPIKERLDLLRELDSLKKRFEGVKNLEKLPEVIFLVCSKETQIVIREARKKEIPLVAIVGADSDPDLIDLPIPANNQSRTAIEFILNKIEKAIGRKTLSDKDN